MLGGDPADADSELTSRDCQVDPPPLREVASPLDMVAIPTIEGLETRAVATEAELARARRLHAQCYVEEGFVAQTELDERGFIEDPWIPYSDYYIAIDVEQDEIVGTCRIIRPSVRGFPIFQHFESHPDASEIFTQIDPNLCVEISSLATPRIGLQNMAISAELYGIVWRESVKGNRAYMLAIMDGRLLRIMRNWFHFPFEPIGPGRMYMGDRTMPVAMYIPRTIEHLRDVSPDSLRFFSRDITFTELDEVAIDLRHSAREHISSVIDLRDAQSARN